MSFISRLHNLPPEQQVAILDWKTGETEIRPMPMMGRRRFFGAGPALAFGGAAMLWSLLHPTEADATQLEWNNFNSPDTAVAGASMNALGGSGSYAIGSSIDNTSGLYTDAFLWIILSSAVTPGSGTPSVVVWNLESGDGTNFPNTNGGSTAGVAPSNLVAGTILPPASTAVQYMALRGITINPAKLIIQIQNNLGVAFPATNTSSCSLYRYRLQAL